MRAAGQSITLRWILGLKSSNRASVEASGLPNPQHLKVFAGEQRETPMAGSIEKRGALVVFVPRFPLLPGTTYYAISGTASASFRLPSPAPSLPTRVLQVYPSASTLPLNLLKFYLHFSAPMSRGDSYQHIRLLKADGTPVDLPFLELAEELWSRLGHTESLTWAAFPVADPALLVDDTVEVPVQVNGKVRARITVSADADDATLEAAARAHEQIAPQLEGKTLRKLVIVPGRLVNFVVG